MEKSNIFITPKMKRKIFILVSRIQFYFGWKYLFLRFETALNRQYRQFFQIFAKISNFWGSKSPNFGDWRYIANPKILSPRLSPKSPIWRYIARTGNTAQLTPLFWWNGWVKFVFIFEISFIWLDADTERRTDAEAEKFGLPPIYW